MDQELVQYLDQQFGGVNRRFEQVDQRFEQVDQHFVQIDQRFESIDRRFEGVDRQFADMRREMSERSEEVKRHFGVLTEELRRQLQLVAEGFTTLDQARIDERFRETHALIRSSYDHLN